MCKKQFKIFFLCFFFLVLATGKSWAQKETFKKADKLYKQREYAAAIPIYEMALSQKNKPSAIFKLAYCYRMLNQMHKAEGLYASLLEEKKVKPITYFYYGEALMSNGKYEEAKKWFKTFDRLDPKDGRGAQMAKACEEVPLIKPYFEHIEITAFNQNSPVDDTAPFFFNDGIIFSSDRKAGIGFLKQKSRWTGREFIKLYFSEQLEDGSFAAPKSYSRKLNALNKNTSCISITADSTMAFFTRNSMLASKRDIYNMQLYQASSKDGKRWKHVKLLPFSNNELNYMHPAVSPDGQFLYFVSDSKKGEGGTDIYVSKRSSKGWGRPQNLGPTINTIANEGFPFMHEDGRLFFCSKGHTGYGGFDIFFSEQDEQGNWSEPTNLGRPINSSLDDITIFLKKDGRSGLFTSSRDGGDDDIFLFEVLEAEASPMVTTETPVKEEERLAPSNATKETPPLSASLPNASTSDASTINSMLVVDTTRNTGSLVAEANPKDTINEVTLISPSPDRFVLKEEEVATTSSTTTEATALPEAVDYIVEIDTVVTRTDTLTQLVISPAIEDTNSAETLAETNTLAQDTTIANSTMAEVEMQVVKEDVINELPAEATQLRTSIATDVAGVAIASEVSRDSARVVPPVDTSLSLEVADKNIYDTWYQLISTQPIEEANTIQISGIQFEKGAHKIEANYHSSLAVLVDFLKRHPSLEVEICGHTWSLGDDDENWQLSKRRARAMVAYLMRQGVHNKRLSFKAFGETVLVNHCDNEVECSPADHARNERLEMKVVRF